MLERVSRTDKTDIPGYREVMHNNIAYAGTLLKSYNGSGSIVSRNSWTLSVSLSSSDFQSLDATQMTQARQSNGSLPNITFMHLTASSDLINVGLNVGLPYTGTAPDLGCFESSVSGSRISEGEPIEELAEGQEEQSNVTVSPNPSNSHFTIKAPKAFNYTIYHPTGMAVENGYGQGSTTAGGSLELGMYIIRVQTREELKSVKVLKN